VFASAFQQNAFQNNAFQIYIPPSINQGGDGFTFEEWKRAQKLVKKIEARQRLLEKATKDANASRKQAIKDLVSPVAKVKKSKVQSIQEVKADIPSVDTQELQRSISYLERQRENILQAVAYRQEFARLQEHLRVLEAKRLAEEEDEQAILLLM
jgi:hypothetical protein